MLTLLAFLFALALLIAVHESGHFLAALSCRVKVLKFSIGFGPALLRRRFGADQTEFVLAAVPLGGFVRMLDEREAPVAAAELPRAFNRQGPWRRAWIVAAGPAANLLLAVLLFALVGMLGVREPLPLLGAAPAGTPAAAAGVHPGQRVLATTIAGETRSVQSWPQLQLRLQQAALDGRRVELRVREAGREQDLQLDFRADSADAGSPDFLRRFGLRLQPAPVRIERVLAGDAAALAGLRAGDLVLGAGPQAPGPQPIDADALLRAIAQSRGQALTLHIQRGARRIDVVVRARAQPGARGVAQWRIGALLDARVPTVLVRLAAWPALQQGARRTWELSALSLRTLGRMVIGQASLNELSGPVTIADYAGRSAALGWAPYLSFLAVVSLSLGVLNLLPIPVLDGGHLLYYAVEILTHRKVPQRVQERLQQGGLALIALMIAVALYNDIARVLGPFH